MKTWEVIAFDAYNLLVTGGVTMTITGHRVDTHTIPVVAILEDDEQHDDDS